MENGGHMEGDLGADESMDGRDGTSKRIINPIISQKLMQPHLPLQQLVVGPEKNTSYLFAD